MGNVMIDIETLGSKPGSAIVSIAAVRFNILTGEPGEEFHVLVNPEDAIRRGLTMEFSTMAWWVKQDLKVVDDAFSGEGETLEDALTKLSAFIKSSDGVWGNSARFDMGLLAAAYDVVDMPIPWKHTKERCVRTLVSLKESVKTTMKFQGDRHNPIDDCKHQIRYCSQIFNELRK